MSRLTLDESLLSKLPTLREPAEICDRAGHRLGWFCPTPTSQKTDSGFSDEDLQRLRSDPANRTGKTWSEVKAWLEQLTAPPKETPAPR